MGLLEKEQNRNSRGRRMNKIQIVQISLLISMVLLFFIYVGFDIYAWPLSKFAENAMHGLYAIILILIDPKEILKMARGDNEEHNDSGN